MKDKRQKTTMMCWPLEQMTAYMLNNPFYCDPFRSQQFSQFLSQKQPIASGHPMIGTPSGIPIHPGTTPLLHPFFASQMAAVVGQNFNLGSNLINKNDKEHENKDKNEN
uniref:Homeobox protein vab-7 (inferred by orthology to a C. elegans protein) n=1 Tax=Strongyloides venezuelensis TaxID=75913 RepID=A0A0K0FXS6_STRVS